MKKHIRITYNNKKYTTGEQILCDLCTKIIYDSRDGDKRSPMYYIAKRTKPCPVRPNSNSFVSYDLCGTECVRSIMDQYLNDTKRHDAVPYELSIKPSEYISEFDYCKRIQKDVPIDQYKRLQREGKIC